MPQFLPQYIKYPLRAGLLIVIEEQWRRNEFERHSDPHSSIFLVVPSTFWL